ncbi:hypothetical protein AAHE18_11G111500 [Arachis hypogaea]
MSYISVHCYNNFSLAGPQAFTATRRCITTPFTAKSGGFSLNSILKGCETCSGKRAIECPRCKGMGKNKKNGNIFERYKWTWILETMSALWISS